MRSIPSQGTEPEKLLRAAVRAAGLAGYRVNLRGAPGRPDLVFTRHKLAVFVHGCFWHRCPHCNLPLPRTHAAFWRRKLELNQERDERNRIELDRRGYDVLEFWECEVRRSAEHCALRITRLIAKSEADVGVEFLVAEKPRAERQGARRQRTSKSLPT